MSPVKPIRKRDREATRTRIVDAARDLFMEQGYARTTIADIARAADVAPQTVYWAFGSKAGLVREIRDAWFASARTSERMGQVLAIDDPVARLDAFAGFMRNQWVSGAAALSIQRDALRVDPDAAADVVAILETRARGLFEVVRPLGPHLAAGPDREEGPRPRSGADAPRDLPRAAGAGLVGRRVRGMVGGGAPRPVAGPDLAAEEFDQHRHQDLGAGPWSWPSSVARSALGSTAASASADACRNGNVSVPSMIRIGVVTDAHCLSGLGSPRVVSAMIRLSYERVWATAVHPRPRGVLAHRGDRFGGHPDRVGHEIGDRVVRLAGRDQLVEVLEEVVGRPAGGCRRR